MKKIASVMFAGALALGALVAASPATAATQGGAEGQVAPSAACIGGIEYWESYNAWSPYLPYDAHARNCGTTTKRVQFIWQGGQQTENCQTVTPGNIVSAGSSQSPYGGFRFC